MGGIGNIFDTLGQFVPQSKQIGEMFEPVSGPCDGFARETAKLESSDQELDTLTHVQAAVRPHPLARLRRKRRPTMKWG